MPDVTFKRVRLYHFKVKSGCRTCKIRRIKCDESRPSCKNCCSTSRECDGYGIWGGGSKASANIKSTGASTPPCTAIAIPIASMTLSKHNTPIPFPDTSISAEEQICFSYFRHRTAVKLPGVFFSHFWDHLVLAASSSDPSILHAAVALGSAHRSQDLNLYGSQTSPGRGTGYRCQVVTVDGHEAFALEQYNKAISHLRTVRLCEDNAALRTALIACVLFTSLELLRGEYVTAITHARHGVNLLIKLRRHGAQDVETRAGTEVFRLKLHPETTEDYLIEAFARLNVQSSLLGGAPDYICSLAEQLAYRGEIEIPSSFRDMYEARQSFDNLLGAILSLNEQCCVHDLAGLPYPAKLLSWHHSLQAGVLAWLQTYTCSLPVLVKGTNERNTLGIPLLRIFHTMASIIVSTALSSYHRESVFDEYTSAFTSILCKIISLYRQASENKSINHQFCDESRISGFSFTVDLGTIPLLYYTALKCRVPWLRRQAIALLLAAPHREGVWDGVVVAHIARKVVMMEENGFFDNRVVDVDALPFESPLERNWRLLHRIPSLPESNRFHHVKIVMTRREKGVGRIICKRQSVEDGCWVDVVEDFDFSGLDRGLSSGVDFPP